MVSEFAKGLTQCIHAVFLWLYPCSTFECLSEYELIARRSKGWDEEAWSPWWAYETKRTRETLDLACTQFPCVNVFDLCSPQTEMVFTFTQWLG